MQKTSSHFGGCSATVSNTGHVTPGPGFTRDGDRDRARITELERRLARLELLDQQRMEMFKEFKWAVTRQINDLIKRNNKDEDRWGDFLKQTKEFAEKLYKWQGDFTERFETTDALTHDVASHLFPNMKQFVDDVDEVCARPVPPKTDK